MSGEDVIKAIAKQIQPIRKKKMSVGVLASGNGSNLQALINYMHRQDCYFSVDSVIVNNPDAYALTRAAQASVKCRLIDHRAFFDRTQFDDHIAWHLKQDEVDLVVLAGFKRLLTSVLLRQYPHRIINIHPSLLPHHKGLHAIKKAIEAHDEITGCTVHLVDEGLDTGPIIAKSSCPIFTNDTEALVTKRIQALEHVLLPYVVNRIAMAVTSEETNSEKIWRYID